MTRTDIRTIVVDCLMPYQRHPWLRTALVGDHLFINDLGVDSSRAIEVLLEVEDRFGIHIPDAEAAAIQTVGDLVRCVVAASEVS